MVAQLIWESNWRVELVGSCNIESSMEILAIALAASLTIGVQEPVATGSIAATGLRGAIAMIASASAFQARLSRSREAVYSGRLRLGARDATN